MKSANKGAPMGVEEQKKALREKIWRLLEDKNVARFPFPIRGRIPNFEGTEKAADLVQELLLRILILRRRK